MVKNLPARQEIQVLFLGQEDSLKKIPRCHISGYPPKYSCLEKSMDRGA